MTTSEAPPIFIGGTGRCGTSLLAAMMMETPHLFPFLEPEGLHRLYYQWMLRTRLPYRLFRRLYCKRLARTLRYSAQWYDAHEPGLLEEWFTNARVAGHLDRTVGAISSSDERHPAFHRFVLDLLGEFTQRCQRRRWCVKQPGFLYENLAVVRSIHPNMKFVHIVRDGRDVISSIINQPWKLSRNPERRFRQAARIWSTTLTRGHDQEQGLDQSQLLTLRFEDLVAEPEREMLRLFDFIGEDLDLPSDYFELRGDHRGNNFDRRRTHVGRYRESLSTEQVSWIEREHGDLLARYSYL